jgi:4-amino-4-deoxy-L-arabinose transferase-like glycosyltransferase
MTSRRPLGLVCLIATLHGIFFIWYQRPDWGTQWPDQEGYRRLGHVLADTGTFTRFPDAPRFAPEVIRTPLYPAVVAVVYRLFGASQIAVALTQTVFFALICVVVYAIGRQVASDGVALAAAAAVALFPPLP